MSNRNDGQFSPPIYDAQPPTVVFPLRLRLGSVISRTLWCSVSRLGKIKQYERGLKLLWTHLQYTKRLFSAWSVRPSVSVFPVVVMWIQTRNNRGCSPVLTACTFKTEVIADGGLTVVRKDRNTNKEWMSKWEGEKNWYKEYHRFLLSTFTAYSTLSKLQQHPSTRLQREVVWLVS